MTHSRTIRIAAGLAGLVALVVPARSVVSGGDTPDVPLGLPADVVASALARSPSEVELGRRLFFDPILSRDRSVSCATCHVPERGFADNTPLSTGVAGRKTLRNTPSLFNRALGETFMWNGQASSLEEQALLPIVNPLEMDLPLDEALARLTIDDAYRTEFADVYGASPSAELLGSSVASFVRTLVHGGSRVDRFRAGERNALSAEERGGLWLFESRGNCWRCHSGPNFSDEDFHNTGVGSRADDPDPGRFDVTGLEADRGRFKTPTLRGLPETAPYMHDGSLATLREVVEFYRDGGHANENLDPLVAPVRMDEQDVVNLVAFLEALDR
jgi:cytochrome c peroxidase